MNRASLSEGQPQRSGSRAPSRELQSPQGSKWAASKTFLLAREHLVQHSPASHPMFCLLLDLKPEEPSLSEPPPPPLCFPLSAGGGGALTDLPVGHADQPFVHKLVRFGVSGLSLHDVALSLLVRQGDGRNLGRRGEREEYKSCRQIPGS